MLRPQVFAWQENTLPDGTKAAIGFAASEKQGIDAALESLAENDSRFWTRADRYWNARGGSHTDGGAFFYKVTRNGNGMDISCTDKFGRLIPMPTLTPAFNGESRLTATPTTKVPSGSADKIFERFKTQITKWSYEQVVDFLSVLEKHEDAVAALTLMMDRRYSTGSLRRSSVLSLIDESFTRVIASLADNGDDKHLYLCFGESPPEFKDKDQTDVIDSRGYEPEGDDSVAIAIQKLYAKGFRKYMVVFAKGHRFIGNGLGSNTKDTRIDVYGSPGDYLASGSDGIEIHVHNNGQDQYAQIMKSGKLVVHGDVGQTFMYAAKGGEVYVLGNAAGRPLINAVGRPRVVINGTCLDYLAESFMAGDPLNGGGFVILNGIAFDEDNQIVEMDTPYPGGNLFSLASGGAIYVRDPFEQVSEDQLNGGEFASFTAQDWALIEPYLQENARQFDIPVERLLTVKGEHRHHAQKYSKIRPRATRALMAEEAWVAHVK